MHAVGLTIYSSAAFSHGKEAYATIQSVPLAVLGPLADFSQKSEGAVNQQRQSSVHRASSPGPASCTAGFALRDYRTGTEETMHPTCTNFGGSLCLAGHQRIQL